MKKIISLLLLVCLFLASFAIAENTVSPETSLSPLPDVSTLTVDQLKELKASINERLLALGELYEDIKSGSQGENVSLLQERLIDLGYYEGEASGTWDKASIAAMKDYEKAVGVKKPDGNASIAEQEALFAEDAMPKPTPAPTPTPDPRSLYGKFDFKSVSRNPEDFKGDKVKISGRVVQVMGSRDEGYIIRLATKGRYDNIVYCMIPSENTPDYNILDEDKITIFAVLAGDHTYTTTMGASITLPLVYVDFVEMTKK